MKFKVIRNYNDLLHECSYSVNDIYPKEDFKTDDNRIKLLSNEITNKYDKVYIVPIDKLTKSELMDLCSIQGIEVPKGALKADIVNLINE